MSLVRPVALMIVAVLAIARPASATFVDFTKAQTGASNLLIINGVTVRGDNGALVEMTFGEGLGMVGFGSNSALERVIHWEEGSDYEHPSGGASGDGELSLSVDGRINSLTILPFVTILEGPQPLVPIYLFMGFTPHIPGFAPTVYINGVTGGDRPPTPVTFTFPGNSPEELPVRLDDVRLYSGFAQYSHFVEYRSTYNNPASTIMFGFSILSLDYTPNPSEVPPAPVPEPATLALLMPGVAALLRARRRPHL